MKKIVLLSLLLIIASPLFSGIEDYFRKNFNKSGNHSIRNIDFIYMINLDQRPEKWKNSLKQLEPYHIVPCRFPAVNGWELSLDAINELGIRYAPGMSSLMATYYPLSGEGPLHEKMHVFGRNYFSHCLSRGAIGIVLSHLSILQDAYDSGYETVWIMEDDIEVIKNPHEISSLIDDLDRLVGGHWDLLFTDQDTKNNRGVHVPCLGYAQRPNFRPANPERFAYRYPAGTKFRKVGARYGAYSMIVRRSGMKKILDFLKKYKIFLPYDMEFYLPADIQIFCLQQDLVSTKPGSPSDNGGPNYKQKMIEDNHNKMERAHGLL